VSLTGEFLEFQVGLSKDKSLVSEGEEHHVNNDDEIDESHRLHDILI